jgi:hypothetical protein
MLLLSYDSILTRLVQRVPDCDLVLVHDDDLARIGKNCDSDVSTHLPVTYHIQTFSCLSAVTGNPSIRYGDTTLPKVPTRNTAGSVWRVTVKFAMLH